MLVTVVSGKGGAGKTVVATSIAALYGARFADLDVDAPNAALYLRPALKSGKAYSHPVPRIDAERCNRCGACARACRFHALTRLPQMVLINADLCHGCLVCQRACPEGAIAMVDHPLGEARSGLSSLTGNLVTIGELRLGAPRAAVLIRQIARDLPREPLTIIDGPPGHSCAAVEAIEPADHVVLVAEATPFGLHDMDLSLRLLERMHTPFSLILNKVQDDSAVHTALADRGLKSAASIGLRRDYYQAGLERRILALRHPEVGVALRQALDPVLRGGA